MASIITTDAAEPVAPEAATSTPRTYHLVGQADLTFARQVGCETTTLCGRWLTPAVPSTSGRGHYGWHWILCRWCVHEHGEASTVPA